MKRPSEKRERAADEDDETVEDINPTARDKIALVHDESANIRNKVRLNSNPTDIPDASDSPLRHSPVDFEETLEEKQAKLETLKLLSDTKFEVAAVNKDLTQEIAAVKEEHAKEEKIGAQKQQELRAELDRMKKLVAKKREEKSKER